MKAVQSIAVVFGIGLAAVMCASAQVTLSGTDLSGLKYSGDPGDAQYVAGTPAVAQLYTPDSGLNGDAPTVFVKAANVGLSSLGPLNAFSASYDLLSSSGPNGAQPYWLTYLYAPGGGYIGVVRSGGPDLTGSSAIHVFYDFATSPLSSDTHWGDTLLTLDSIPYGTTTFGQMIVYESGVEIGDWANGASIIPASANIDSITIVPEPSTALLVGTGLMSMLMVARRRNQTHGLSR